MKNQKRYPFSIARHAHDIEYRRNRAYNASELEIYKALSGLLQVMKWQSKDGRITWLTGPQIALAKESVAWAEAQRNA